MLWRAPWVKSRIGLAAFAIWDACCVTAIYTFLYGIRIYRLDYATGGSIGFTVLWSFLSYITGRYSPKDVRAQNKLRDAISDLVTTLTIGSVIALIFIGHSWLMGIDDAGTRYRGFLVPLVVLISVASTSSNTLVRLRGRRLLPWTIIASDEELKVISRTIDELQPGLEVDLCSGKEMLSRPSNEMGDTELVVSARDLDCEDLAQRLIIHKSTGGRIKGLEDWLEDQLHFVPPELVDEKWLLTSSGFKIQPGRTGWRIKRLGDIVGATGLLIVSAPWMVLFAILVYIEDGGPVLYRQTRTGLFGKEFTLWKIRSMRVDSEKNGALWSNKGDSRVTKVGRFIRKFRIDELPQLVSVITGELSLVGPRPERPELEEIIENKVPNYRIRHWIKPGLTGWAQVCYPYGASIEDSKMKLGYDMYYIRNSGVMLDILICIKTLKLLANAEGSVAKK